LQADSNPTSTVPTSVPVADPRAVLITNISPKATEKSIADFFAFCGKITRLSLRRSVGPDSTHEAVIYFESEAPVATALLLTNAQVEGRAIVVQQYTPPSDSSKRNDPYPEIIKQGDEIENKHFSDDHRTHASTIASMIAAGYCLGADTLAKAKDYDEKHNISLQLKIGAEELKKKVLEIDNSYGISAKAVSIASATSEKIKQVDQNYHISETMAEKAKTIDQNYGISSGLTATGQYIAATANSLKQTSMDWLSTNPTVQSAATTISSYTAPIGQSIANIERESAELIAERQKNKLPGEQSNTVDSTSLPPVSPSVAFSPLTPTSTVTTSTQLH